MLVGHLCGWAKLPQATPLLCFLSVICLSVNCEILQMQVISGTVVLFDFVSPLQLTDKDHSAFVYSLTNTFLQEQSQKKSNKKYGCTVKPATHWMIINLN